MEIAVKPVGLAQANCYIIDRRVMIDAGDDVPAMNEFISEQRAQIEAIALTHGHFDHMLGAAYIKRDAGAKIYISEGDAECLKDESSAIVLPFAQTPFLPTEPDEILREGETEIGGIKFEVMLTPGHTRGGACLVNHENRLVFTGDTLFRFGYGRTDLPGGDIHKLRASIMRLLRLPDYYYIYPGHGEGAYIGELKGGIMP